MAARCIEWEELSDVIPVGHSYGGMVIAGVADRMSDRIRSLVYLDAFVPEHGDSLIGLLSKALAPEVAAQFIGAFRGTALQDHRGLMQPIPAEMFSIAVVNRARVDRPLPAAGTGHLRHAAATDRRRRQGREPALHPGRRLGPEPVSPLRGQGPRARPAGAS